MSKEPIERNHWGNVYNGLCIGLDDKNKELQRFIKTLQTTRDPIQFLYLSREVRTIIWDIESRLRRLQAGLSMENIDYLHNVTEFDLDKIMETYIWDKEENSSPNENR